jgi:hypothetical protein
MLRKLSTEGSKILNNVEENSEKCIEFLMKGNSIYRKVNLNNTAATGSQLQHPNNIH